MIESRQVVMAARELRRQYRVSRGFLRGSAQVHALNGVSFDLLRGTTLAIVGESGCGKSTLARLLCMIEPPDAGQLTINGEQVVGADKHLLRAMRSSVQMVFQNPFASLNPRQRIATMLAEPLVINTKLTKAERDERVELMLNRVGLHLEHLQRYPHMFSGGQRQRIAIARAMMLNPDVVVADEPTSALDVSIQAQVLNLMMDLQASLGTSYVLIAHNLAVVEHVADSVLVMYLGAGVEYGAKSAIFARPLHPYTQALMSATPAIRPEDRRIRITLTGEPPSPLQPPSGCAFHPRCPFALARCRHEAPALRQVEDRRVACHRIEELNS